MFRPAAQVENPYVRHYVTGGLELLAMALDFFAFTEDRGFARRVVGPLARSVLTWFDRHYGRSIARRAKP